MRRPVTVEYARQRALNDAFLIGRGDAQSHCENRYSTRSCMTEHRALTACQIHMHIHRPYISNK